MSPLELTDSDPRGDENVRPATRQFRAGVPADRAVVAHSWPLSRDCRSHLTAGQHDIARRRKVYAPADVNAATIALVKPVQNTGPESLRRVRGVLLSPRPDTTSARSFSTVRMIVEIVDLLEAPTEKRLTRWSPAMLTSPMLAVIYTVGDFTVAQVGTSLFTVGSEPFGTLAYISTLAEAERRGHEMAKTHGVSLWLADVTHPRTFLIASYRRST